MHTRYTNGESRAVFVKLADCWERPYYALTDRGCSSPTYKTERGGAKWLEKRGFTKLDEHPIAYDRFIPTPLLWK